MRLSVLLAVAALALLVLGTYMIGIDAIRSQPGSHASMSDDERVQTYIQRDERGRPVCRRGRAGDDPSRIVAIGQNCP